MYLDEQFPTVLTKPATEKEQRQYVIAVLEAASARLDACLPDVKEKTDALGKLVEARNWACAALTKGNSPSLFDETDMPESSG